MALDAFKNFARGTASTGYAAGVTTVVLTTGHGARMPSGETNYTWWNSTDFADPSDDPDVEIIRGTIASDTITVSARGVEGTSDVDHNTGGKTYSLLAPITAKTLNVDLPATFAPIASAFVTIGADGTLTSERALTGTSNQVVVTDNGAGSTVVLSLPQSIATTSTPTFGGLTVSNLTSGRVPIVSTGGLLADTDDLKFDPSVNAPWRMRLFHDAITAQAPIDVQREAYRTVVESYGAGDVAAPKIAKSIWMNDSPSAVNKTISNAVDNGSGLIRITATGHGFTTGDGIGIYGVTGTTEANAVWVITVIDANTFDLQGSAFSNAYVSGGTATNRSMMYGVRVIFQPTLDRTDAGAAPGAFNDDLTAFAVQNSASGPAGKATDAFYLAGSPGITGPAWVNAYATDADSNYFFRAVGTAYTAGIDLSSASYDGSAPAIALGPAGNISLDTATGTKIGTATSQKLGFFNATPVVQNTSTTDLRTGLINLGLFASGGASPLHLNGGSLTALFGTFSGRTITTDATATVAAGDFGGTFTKNDSNAYHFPVVLIKPTLNLGGSNANTTAALLELNTVNTSTTGMTLDLLRGRFGDSPRFYVTNTGAVDTYSDIGSVVGINSYNDSATTTAGLHFRRYRGTIAAPRRAQSGDTVAGFTVRAGSADDDSTTAGLSNVAAIRAFAKESYTASANGTYFAFQTAPTGGTGLTSRLIADEIGIVLGASIPARSTTQPTNALTLLDGTAPVGTLTNAVQLYSASGELRSMDSAGNSTLLSPHDKDTNEWVFDSVLSTNGKRLRIDMERLMRKLDAMFGGGYIHESHV